MKRNAEVFVIRPAPTARAGAPENGIAPRPASAGAPVGKSSEARRAMKADMLRQIGAGEHADPVNQSSRSNMAEELRKAGMATTRT